MVRGAEKQTAQWQSGEMVEMGGDREVVSFTERFKQKKSWNRGGEVKQRNKAVSQQFVLFL